MSKKSITSGATKKVPPTDWKKLREMSDEDIDCSDIPASEPGFWDSAHLIVPTAQVSLAVRFDSDVVDWFKKQGPGYQTRMNAALRTYIKSKKRRKAAS